MKRFRVVVRDRKTGEAETLNWFEARSRDDAVSRLNLSGLIVDSVHEVEMPAGTKPPNRLLVKVKGGAARAWGSLDKQARVFLGALAIGIPIVIIANSLPESAASKEQRAREERWARDSAAVPRPAPIDEITVPLDAENRLPREVWRDKLVSLVKGDIIAPGVTIHDIVLAVKHVGAEGTQCRSMFLIENFTGTDVDVGNAVVCLLDETGLGIWRGEPRRAHVDKPNGEGYKNILMQDIFVPPSEWKRAKKFSVVFVPAR